MSKSLAVIPPLMKMMVSVKPAAWAKMAHVGSRSLPLLSLLQRRHGGRYDAVFRRMSLAIGTMVAAFTTAAVAHSMESCPYTGRYRLLMTSVEEDTEIGNQASHVILSKLPASAVLSSTHPLTKLCQTIVDRITVRADLGVSFKITVISDTTKNAYALPNGDIILHAGVLADIKNEDELAGLLAHEMAHTVLRHSSEVQSVSDLVRIPSGFVYSLVAISGSGAVSGAVRWLAVKLVNPERLVAHIPLSRKLESEADTVGVDIMAKAGFDPTAVVDYWSRQCEKSSSSPRDKFNIGSLFSSHPHNKDRLADLRMHIEKIAPATAESATTPTGASSWWWWRSGTNRRSEQELSLEYWIDRISSQLDQNVIPAKSE